MSFVVFVGKERFWQLTKQLFEHRSNIMGGECSIVKFHLVTLADPFLQQPLSWHITSLTEQTLSSQIWNKQVYK